MKKLVPILTLLLAWVGNDASARQLEVLRCVSEMPSFTSFSVLLDSRYVGREGVFRSPGLLIQTQSGMAANERVYDVQAKFGRSQDTSWVKTAYAVSTAWTEYGHSFQLTYSETAKSGTITALQPDGRRLRSKVECKSMP